MQKDGTKLFQSAVVLLQIDPVAFEESVQRNLDRNSRNKEAIADIYDAARLEVALRPEEAARKRLEAQKKAEELDKFRVKNLSQKRIEWLARDPARAVGWIKMLVKDERIEDARRVQIQVEKNRKTSK